VSENCDESELFLESLLVDSDYSSAKMFNMNHYNDTIVRDEFSHFYGCRVYRIPFSADYLCLRAHNIAFYGYIISSVVAYF
jgi:hypothetical protein